MRVLIVSQYFWPENFRINAIVESLVARGIEVDVLTGKPNYPDGVIASGYHFWGSQREVWKGATLYRVPLVPRGRSSHLGLVLNYFSFVIFCSTLGVWLIRGRRYDVIFVYGVSPILSAIPAVLIGRLKGTKVITWIQDLWPESLAATGYIKNRCIIGVLKHVVRFIYKHSHLLLIQSRAFEAPVRALASGTPVEYYPNSVEDIFNAPVKDETPIVNGLSEGFSIMFAGNIGAAQGVDVIVKAALLLREQADIHFVVMGDGSCREDMLKSVQRNGLENVHLVGRFPLEMMPGFLGKASVLLVTLADRPIFSATVPSKIQAYMAVGKPIIACLNGEGARLVVEARAGLTTAAEDAKALAKTILRLYGLSAAERKTMGDNGRSYYQQHFDHEALVGQLIELMQTMTRNEKS